MMDIHKPKPVRSWRELLTEVGIIVLSVCIALSAEQAVEWVHWRNQVTQARQALAEEIAVINGFYVNRVAISPCLVRRMDKVEQLIEDAAVMRKLEPVDIPERGTGALLSDSEWQSERSAQTLTHFPRRELAMMSRYYAQVPEFVEWETKEADAWWGLRVLRHAGDGLSPADLASARLNIQIARHHQLLIELNARRMLALSDQLGFVRPRPDAERVNKFCTLSSADFVHYMELKEPH